MLYMTPRAKAAIDIAVQQAQKLGDEFVGTEHLLLGIFLEGEGPGSAVLKDLGMTEESLQRALAEVRDTGVDYEATPPARACSRSTRATSRPWPPRAGSTR